MLLLSYAIRLNWKLQEVSNERQRGKNDLAQDGTVLFCEWFRAVFTGNAFIQGQEPTTDALECLCLTWIVAFALKILKIMTGIDIVLITQEFKSLPSSFSAIFSCLIWEI